MIHHHFRLQTRFNVAGRKPSCLANRDSIRRDDSVALQEDRDHTSPTDQRASARRNAFTMIELVVAASIMIALMSVVTSLTFRIHKVWQDTNQQRIATWAVSSELERITSLPTDEIAATLDELAASEELQNLLTAPEWSGDFIDDELGPRVALRLNWKRRHPGVPLELVGWLLDPTANQETSP